MLIASMVEFRTTGGPRPAPRRKTGAVRWWLLAEAALVAFTACAPDAPLEGPARTERLPVEVEEPPVLTLGIAAGDTAQEFFRVHSPFFLLAGDIVVPVQGSAVIRVFGRDGGLVRTLGRPGAGPGEFELLSSAWARGDTIEAFDSRLQRITRFPPEGGSPQVITVRAPVRLTGVPPGWLQEASPGPLPAGWAFTGLGNAALGTRDEVRVDRIGGDGAFEREVTRLGGMVRTGAPGRGGAEVLSPRSVVRGGLGYVYAAETLTPAIDVFDEAGALIRTVRWEPDQRLSGREAVRLLMEAALAAAPPDEAAAIRGLIEADGIPETVSVFWDFIVDAYGFFWIRPFDPAVHAAYFGFGTGGYSHSAAGLGGVWTILSPAGQRVGSIRVPDGFSPVQATSDALLGISRDRLLGTETVRVYRLRRE